MDRSPAWHGRLGRGAAELMALCLSGCANFHCITTDLECARAEKAMEECRALENQEFDRCQSRAEAATMACGRSRSGCGEDAPLPDRMLSFPRGY